MANILLINSPIRLMTKPSVFPIGLGIIAAVLGRKGHNVNIMDVNAHRYNHEETVKELVKHRDSEIVGISGLVTTYGFQKWLAQEIKKHMPQAKVIAGGGCVTSISEIVFKNATVDFAVLHEGEETIVDLIDAVVNNRDLSEVRGIVFRKNSRHVKTQARSLINNLDTIPFPEYEKFPLEIYIDNLTEESRDFNRGLRSMPILCSRGCPFNCNFCFHFFGGPSYRTRSVANILREIDLLKEKYGIGFFSLIDENLLVKKDYLAILCAELKKRDIIWECWGRVDLADDRLKMMADAGCVRISYGVESGSQKILDNMNKKITPEMIRKAVRTTRRYGIDPETTWIYGYPGETRQTLQESYLLKKELRLRPGGFFINPYPGTKLYDDCLEKGLIKNEEEFILKIDDATKFVINFTDFKNNELIETVRRLERNLAISNCLRSPRYFLKVLRYKWQQLIKKVHNKKGRINGSSIKNLKNFLLIPYRILILPDYEDFPNPKIPRFGLQTCKDERINITLKYVKGRLLDIGCGRYNSAIRKYKNGYGIDVCMWEGIDILCDTVNIPFKDETFDSVSFIASFNHMPVQKINFVIKDVYRVLKKDGLLLIITDTNPIVGYINHEIFHKFDDVDRKRRGIGKGEIYGYRHRKLVSLLVNARFTYIKRVPFLCHLSNLYIFQK